MQVPRRKAGKLPNPTIDHQITERKYQELKDSLRKLKLTRPKLATEVKRSAEFGDFSENAEYQLAKGKLRGLNQRIDELEYQINHAEIIKPVKGGAGAQVGNFVTIEAAGQTRRFQILGSAETNPKTGVISRHSPLGSVLLGHKVGDIVKTQMTNKSVDYRIIKIE